MPEVHRPRDATKARRPGTARALTEEAVAGVEAGLLSVEQLLRAAARGARFRTWLARTIDRARPHRVRRVRIRQRRQPPAAVIGRALSRVRRKLRRRRDVVSIHWGARRAGGRVTGCAGVVVVVRRKLPPDRLQAARVCPSEVRVRHRSATFRVPVDVQALLPGTAQAGAFNVAHQTALSVGGRPGTLGGLLSGPDGVHGITAGHVAEAEGRQATARFGNGTPRPAGPVKRVVMSAVMDLARFGPVPPETAGHAAGPIAAFRDPDPGDVHTQVRVLRLAEPGGAVTFVADVGISATLLYPDGNSHTLTGLTALSPAVTAGGDSGAPVIDHQGTVLGFVVGASSDRTYIVPARKGIDAL